jgi:hypothetical protein
MLKQPRRLPSRYNRPVTPQMRRIVQQRHTRQRQHRRQQWLRSFQRFQRKAGQLKAMILRFALVLVGCLLALCIGLALFSPILHIREIRVPRSDPRIDAEQIQSALRPFFDQHLFFLTSDQVEQAIDAAIPDLQEVSVSKQYPGTLALRVTLDPIVARLVIEGPDQTSQSGTGAVTGSGVVRTGDDYLTDKGVYVTYNPSQVESGSGGLMQLTVVDWAVRPEPGRQLIDEEMLTAMNQAEQLLVSEFDLPVSRRVVYLRAREFHLKLPAYSLWFDVRTPLDEQMQRFRIYVEQIGAGKAKEYVDLRIQGKIVYK